MPRTSVRISIRWIPQAGMAAISPASNRNSPGCRAWASRASGFPRSFLPRTKNSSETAASKTKDAKEEKAPKTQKVQKKPKKARISKEEPAENAVSPEAGKDDLVQEIPSRDPQVLDPQSQGIQEAPASADALYEAWKAEMDASGSEK